METERVYLGNPDKNDLLSKGIWLKELEDNVMGLKRLKRELDKRKNVPIESVTEFDTLSETSEPIFMLLQLGGQILLFGAVLVWAGGLFSLSKKTW